jgi:UDP-N-acetylglucosamine 2-epimerase (non-hydrolysing)
LCVFGTRPEAVKLAPVIKAQNRLGEDFLIKTCVTGQHRQMLDQVLDVFEIKPDFDLQIMSDRQTVNHVIALILEKLSPILQAERPDVVIVQGDTASTFGAALAAFNLRIPVAHVEAGLRTYDLCAPFPEEGLRQMVSRIAACHFAPTERNKSALVREGIAESDIFITGNTVVDALLLTRAKLLTLDPKMFSAQWQRAAEVVPGTRKLILVTGHRRESFGTGIRSICNAIATLAKQHPDVCFVYPVHPNPAVVGPVKDILGCSANVYLIRPLDYFPFVYLMMRSHFIISDSGGIQEEALSLGKPVLVTRSKTERPEAVEVGAVRLVGSSEECIVRESTLLLRDETAHASMVTKTNPYGDGHAAERIVGILISRLQQKPPAREARL